MLNTESMDLRRVKETWPQAAATKGKEGERF
jgi:hypothetical protein